MEYKIIVGCYGSRRGTALGELTDAFIKTSNKKYDITVLGRGHPTYIGNKIGKPLDTEHIESLLLGAQNYSGYSGKVDLDKIVRRLSTIGRKAATPEELRTAEYVFAVDDFILNEYAKLAGEKPHSVKYLTVLRASGLKHPRFGDDIDETEASMEFREKVIIPSIEGKVPADLSKDDARYYDLAGKEYRSGDCAARDAEARDLIQIAERLASFIICTHPISISMMRALRGDYY